MQLLWWHFQDADSDGVCDANDQCPGTNDALIGTNCDDGNACTTVNDIYTTITVTVPVLSKIQIAMAFVMPMTNVLALMMP
ncbi:MAG: hypothetical protein R2728_11375 [Chitinophagales bacterium]